MPYEIYRGTQRTTIEGALKGMSFAATLPVAIIWSAIPGDIFANRPTKFASSSTVHIATVMDGKALNLGDLIYCSFGDILRVLRYDEEDGITFEEAKKILTYMHNRLMGKARGGDFTYEISDDEEDDYFSFTSTRISRFRDDWEYNLSIEFADRLIADTFVFADAPAVQRAALALGFDTLQYEDVFQGGELAAKDLFGIDNVEILAGIEYSIDLKGDEVPSHETIRILDPSKISQIVSTPTNAVLQALDLKAAYRATPRTNL